MRDLSARIPLIMKTPNELRREISQLETSQILKNHLENTLVNNAIKSDHKVHLSSLTKTKELPRRKRKLSMHEKLIVLGRTTNEHANLGLPQGTAATSQTIDLSNGPRHSQTFVIPKKQSILRDPQSLRRHKLTKLKSQTKAAIGVVENSASGAQLKDPDAGPLQHRSSLFMESQRATSEEPFEGTSETRMQILVSR